MRGRKGSTLGISRAAEAAVSEEQRGGGRRETSDLGELGVDRGVQGTGEIKGKREAMVSPEIVGIGGVLCKKYRRWGLDERRGLVGFSNCLLARSS